MLRNEDVDLAEDESAWRNKERKGRRGARHWSEAEKKASIQIIGFGTSGLMFGCCVLNNGGPLGALQGQ